MISILVRITLTGISAVLVIACQPLTDQGNAAGLTRGDLLGARTQQVITTDRNFIIAGMGIRHPYSLYAGEPPENYLNFGVLPKGTSIRITEMRLAGDLSKEGASYYVGSIRSGKFRDWRVELFEKDIRRFEAAGKYKPGNP